MGRISKGVLLRIFREAMGIGVPLACIGWVLGHLIVFFSHGYVVVGESSKPVLLVEVFLISVGLLCFVITLYEDKLSSKK